MSHAAERKRFTVEVAKELRTLGLFGFVAHEDIEPTREWQQEIAEALNSCEAFVVLLHREAVASQWVNQEIGWATARGIPFFALRCGADPRGFIANRQWPSVGSEPDADQTARVIARWANGQPKFSQRIVGALLSQLRESGNYYAAEEASKALDEFDALTPMQFAELDRIFLENDQVGGSVLATRALRPLYDRHGRNLPEA